MGDAVIESRRRNRNGRLARGHLSFKPHRDLFVDLSRKWELREGVYDFTATVEITFNQTNNQHRASSI